MRIKQKSKLRKFQTKAQISLKANRKISPENINFALWHRKRQKYLFLQQSGKGGTPLFFKWHINDFNTISILVRGQIITGINNDIQKDALKQFQALIAFRTNYMRFQSTAKEVAEASMVVKLENIHAGA